MTTPVDTHIESILRDMTADAKGAPQLWRRALRSTTDASKRTLWSSFMHNLLHRPLPTAAMLIIAFSATIAAIGVSMPSLSRSRAIPTDKRAQINSMTVGDSAFRHDEGLYNLLIENDESGKFVGQAKRTPREFVSPSTTDTPDAAVDLSYSLDSYAGGSIHDEQHQNTLAGRGRRATPSDGTADSSAHSHPTGLPGSTPPTGERHVIRRATIEIKTTDVRGAFLKAQHLLETGHGEYVQDSSIRGEVEDARAEMTLRVAAGRLSAVLNALRELGDVQTEYMTGEDVTMQIVDLEARLRNEQRVEAEVLKLLETRQDAPLEEVLKLRQSLGEIRTRIEQMLGQREQLGRLVSLSTILVLIRAGDPPPVEADSLWTAFCDSMSSAWRNGVAFLGDVIAAIVRVLIGGLVFWIALIAVIFAIRRRVLRNAAK